jgi:hypothetical protein
MSEFVMLPPPLEPDGEIVARKLSELPVNDPNRPKLRDRVKLSAKQLETRCRRFCTLSPAFKPNPVTVDRRPAPRYADWLALACRPRPIAKAAPLNYPPVPLDAPEQSGVVVLE